MSVTATAPAKINLALVVGPRRADGFHDLATVYQAIDLLDEVSVESAAPGSGISVRLLGHETVGVPASTNNIAAKAAALVAREAGVPADFDITITKNIPTAGGMAGGSADAGAALLATDALLNADLGRDALLVLAAQLGSDVPFSLVGNTAVGTGRGEIVVPTLARGEFHWVIAMAHSQLATPSVFAQLDLMRTDADIPTPAVPVDLAQALVAGDVEALSNALVNDMQPATLALRPELQRTLDAGTEAGALAALISGSGPTTLFLARDEEHAIDLAVMLSSADVCRAVRRASGPVPGARIVDRT